MTSTGQPAAQQVLIAEESYRRVQGDAFFQAFYRRLLDTEAPVHAKFARTDFQRQNKLLQHGIGLLFSFAKRPNPVLLERIAQRHGHGDLDIPPDHYRHFADGLVATLREFDPRFDATVEDAWRRALAPGIAFIASRYDSSTSGAADATGNSSPTGDAPASGNG